MSVSSDLMEQIENARDATRRLVAGLRGLSDADVARPSLCPGWTVGHVLTHIARNADALRRVAVGAERGEVLSLYESREARGKDIEAGAGRPAADLVSDVTESARRLDEAWQALDEAVWDRLLLHPRHGQVPLRDTPAMRRSELEIHRVDLVGEYRPADWPAPFVAVILDGMPAMAVDRLPAGVTLAVHVADTGQRWICGTADGPPVTVSGPSWAVAAWLTGRTEPVRGALSATSGELPVLAPLA